SPICSDRLRPEPQGLRRSGWRRSTRACSPAPSVSIAVIPVTRPPKTEPTYKTRIATRDTIGITVNADYKHSRVKQYLKDGRALRIETVVNDPGDLVCKRRLPHLPELQTKARAVNARLLDTERVGQGCVLAS